MKRRFGKAVLKGLNGVSRAVSGNVRRLVLSLVWEFEGSARIEGRVIVRSFGGDVSIGTGVLIGPMVVMGCAKGGVLTVGRGTTINQGSFVEAVERIDIGANCLIGSTSAFAITTMRSLIPPRQSDSKDLCRRQS